jgi:hypothetical protein
VQAFINEFQTTYLARLTQTHINIIMQRREQFVGDRCLSLSIKFLEMSMSYKSTRTAVKPHIETILFNISLPLFITSQKDMQTFYDDPVEYVRLQNDS